MIFGRPKGRSYNVFDYFAPLYTSSFFHITFLELLWCLQLFSGDLIGRPYIVSLLVGFCRANWR